MSYQSRFTGAEIDAGIDAANAALPKNGGTMMGALILAGDPADEKAAVTKKYVDEAVQNIASTPGNDGEDGVSPTITVTEITGGHRITITDANGTQSFDVMDGEDGADGSGGDGSGDMLKSVYDADNDGTVDNAAKLGGKAPSEYYGKENQPPYPVTSVNGMTGEVVIAGGGGSGDPSVYVGDDEPASDSVHAWIETDSEEFYNMPEINDGIVSSDDTWSSAKISLSIEEKGAEINAALMQRVDERIPTEMNYSTDEVNTNKKWIDGKPIYRRTIIISKPSTTAAYHDLTQYNFNTICYLAHTETFSYSGNSGYWGSDSYYNSANDNFRIYVNRSGSIVVGAGSNTSAVTAYVTIEYTKTTD